MLPMKELIYNLQMIQLFFCDALLEQVKAMKNIEMVSDIINSKD